MTHLCYSALSLDTKADELAGLISGMASTFGLPADLAGDVIVKGAFSETLRQHQEQGSSVAMLYSHRQDACIGKWLNLRETDQGLEVQGQLAKGVRVADECLKLAGMQALALSIGFRPIRQKAVKDANYIEAVDLVEISLTAVPANRRTNLQVKSLGSVHDYQLFLREAGLSVREAKRLARSGWGAYAGSEVDEAEIAEFLRASTFRLKGI